MRNDAGATMNFGILRALAKSEKDFSAVLISILVDCDGELFGSSLIRFRQLNTEVFNFFWRQEKGFITL